MKKNINGYLHFYVHFMVEVACFFFLSRLTNNSNSVWLIPFLYDGLAFVPQSMIGYISDKYPKINMGIIGTIFLVITYLLYGLTNVNVFIMLITLCLGNAFLHICSAENTLKNSNGRLAPAAIYVAGGSFGVITGRILATTSINPLILLLPILSLIPFILLADSYKTEENNCNKFDYVRKDISPYLVVLIAFIVVVVRGYLGYGIPTSWKKTVLENVIFFCIMGLGKALGGVLADRFGIRKIAILSTLLAIPFLCFGDKIMLVSIIGVMFFSMTMSITLAILVSVLKKTPGLAFGITTIGLFLGTVPIFFIKLTQEINIILIIVISILCSIALGWVLKKEDNNEIHIR